MPSPGAHAEKKSPSAAATATRTKSNVINAAKSKPSGAKKQSQERREFTVNDGRDAIGYIKQRGASFAASSAPSHRRLGAFGTMKEAYAAICEAHGGGPHA